MGVTDPKWRQWRTYRPTRSSFLAIHYSYILILILIGSVTVFGHKNLPFIDALFFAAGAATQSGLNTVDVIQLKTYQQIVLYFIPLVANPIFINTAIVRVRIHWFEKRLDELVKEARLGGRWRSQTRSRAKPDTQDPEREERGVDGRPITVLLNESRPASLRGSTLTTPASGQLLASSLSSKLQSPAASARNSTDGTPTRTPSTPEHMQEKIDECLENDKVTPNTDSQLNLSSSSSLAAPKKDEPESTAPHIAFVENRPPKRKSGVLRVPGPLGFERGENVEELEEEDVDPLRRSHTTGGLPSDGNNGNDPSIPGRMRRRMGSFSERIIPRAQTLDRAISSAVTVRGRSSSPMSRLSRRATRPDPGAMPYLSYTPTVGRNSAFVDLTDEQMDELGGLEYRALKLLYKILVGYFVIFHIIGITSLLPWIYNQPKYGKIVEDFGVNKAWWAIFTSMSAFMDLGFTLTPDSMASFQDAVWVLLISSFLIIIGNTGFPCMLRLIIWIMKKMAPAGTSIEAPLSYLLDHPRRCFTLLFPSGATWALFGILVLLNALDLLLFIILDLKDTDVTSIPTGIRILAGYFQAVSTRTAGLSVVNLSALHPAVQVSYMVMMYISIFPIAISVRRTNVYEESALGIYINEEEVGDGKNASFIGAHLRNQLQYDIWYIFLGLFLIACFEGRRVENTNEYAFTLFSILFEVVSAYGTVGLSLGYPNSNTSFSGQFKPISKLVIIAMQIRGRHRGLPYQVDRAILLPSESLLKDKKLQRRPSFLSPGGQPLLPRSLSQASRPGPALGRSMSQATTATRNPAIPQANGRHED